MSIKSLSQLREIFIRTICKKRDRQNYNAQFKKEEMTEAIYRNPAPQLQSLPPKYFPWAEMGIETLPNRLNRVVRQTKFFAFLKLFFQHFYQPIYKAIRL